MYNDPGANINPKQNDLWKPVIAAVNGMACGGALYMLGEADIVIAAEHATFFDPHVTYGMVAGFESIHLLQKLPLGETLRLALLGAWERMSAAAGARAGPRLRGGARPTSCWSGRMWVANAIASAPVLAIQGTLRAVWMAHEVTRKEALAQMSTLVALGTTFENIESGQAEFENTRPEWRTALTVVVRSTRQAFAISISRSATACGSVIIRSWPVSMSHSRPSSRARSMSSRSRVASVDVHTMWNCGMAHSASSLVSSSFCSKHFQGWPVSRSSIQARSSGSVTP